MGSMEQKPERRGAGELPYSGLVTFARGAPAELGTDWRADVGVLGVPFDLALGFRPGARFAPRAVREASLRYAIPPEGFYDLRADRMRLAGVTIRDAGDVLLPALEPELARERITSTARQLRAHVGLPLFLGGDHSVTHPLLRAFDDVPDLHIVQLDAHLDFTDQRNETRHSNSSPFRRAAEDLPNLKHITTIGLRGLRADREAVGSARARGHTLVPAWELESMLAAAPGASPIGPPDTFAAALPEGRNVYLSIDVDVFDPAVLPGTSSPEVDGLAYAQVMAVIAAAVRRNTLVGLDLVELAPNLDASGNSSLLAARLLVETLAEHFG